MTKRVVIYSPGLNKILIVKLYWARCRIIFPDEIRRGTYIYIGEFD